MSAGRVRSLFSITSLLLLIPYQDLPSFSIPYLQQLKIAKVSETLEDTTSQSTATTPAVEYPSTATPSKSRRLRKDSLDDPEADPWASPAPHKNTTLPIPNDASSKSSTAARPISNGYRGASRTTSAFTTHSADPGSNSSNLGANTPGQDATTPGWGSYDNTGSNFPNGDQSGLGGSDLGNTGFGSSDGPERNSNPTTSQTLGRSKSASRGVEENVTITVLPEKEGMFMFQHRNYEVKSARRASTVIRRYSDFVWLLDCLHKRYPFRQLPLLPPKRVAVNGRHLSSDVTFIEKRRRGLVRFSNALVRHPVLSQEQLVVMFLTVPTELAVWRKQATISVQEEFVGKTLPSGLEDSLPLNLQETFDTVRIGVKKSSETYIGLCSLLERLAKRNQGLASDYSRFSTSLRGLLEDSPSTYATDTNDVPLLNEGISSAARHLETSQNLLEDEARAWDEGILEDLKRQRDTLVGVRDMFDRRDRYARDNIPQLERRIEANENKLAGIRARPEGVGKPGEAQKVEEAIMSVGASRTCHLSYAKLNLFRTNNPLSTSTLEASSLKNAFATSWSSSRLRNITSVECIRTGVRSVSSMRNCRRIIGGRLVKRWRICRWATRVDSALCNLVKE